VTGENYRVVSSLNVMKQVEKLKRDGRGDIVSRFLEAARQLEKNPYQPRSGVDIRPLKGSQELAYRLRIGRYRALYEIFPEERLVRFTTIAKRERIYD